MRPRWSGRVQPSIGSAGSAMRDKVWSPPRLQMPRSFMSSWAWYSLRGGQPEGQTGSIYLEVDPVGADEGNGGEALVDFAQRRIGVDVRKDVGTQPLGEGF